MKLRLFAPILAGWLALDVVTKQLALAVLQPPGVPHQVLGDVVRFTLSFNRGAALGMSLGEWSRPAFTAISLAMLVVLWHLYRTTAPADRLRTVVLALITAGALGNLIDRLRWDRGVVDFIDIGIGRLRWWTFNVADAGITVGALALAVILGRQAPPAPGGVPPARAPAGGASARSPSDTRPGRRRSGRRGGRE
jgi:signal peptidase II